MLQPHTAHSSGACVHQVPSQPCSQPVLHSWIVLIQGQDPPLVLVELCECPVIPPFHSLGGTGTKPCCCPSPVQQEPTISAYLLHTLQPSLSQYHKASQSTGTFPKASGLPRVLLPKAPCLCSSETHSTREAAAPSLSAGEGMDVILWTISTGM